MNSFKRGATWGSSRDNDQRQSDQKRTHRPRLAIAVAAIIAMVATVAPPAPDADSTPEGLLGTSMIEMLDGENASGALTLNELRGQVLRGYGNSDGTGVDVAVIDTGVAPVAGLDGANVLHGPDLSLEGSISELEHLDTYGHGTHMAGIIAGQRKGAEGIAPGARIVSVKVAGHDGLTSVPQVIAAIDWVVEHRNTDGLNIRVLNLSLGQAGVTTHVGDPLSAAVERAWDAGIFVVVAAGNNGDTRIGLDSPAIDPYVMAVGAADTLQLEFDDGGVEAISVPAWSARGDGNRNPDAVGPGRSIASYRVPGSTIDTAAPTARYGDTFFRGSGTSQAAAVVSGLAAVVISHEPGMTNEYIKHTVTATTMGFEGGGNAIKVGHGFIDGRTSASRPEKATPQTHKPAAGDGTGIVAPSGNSWSGGSWSGNSWSGNSWSGGSWSGNSWSGNSWSGNSWSGNSWSGNTWSGGSWSGNSWSGNSWSGGSWSGGSWS
jgi:serine protease AprX